MAKPEKRFHFSVDKLESLPIPKEGPATYFDRDVRQLAVRIQPTGTRTFFVLKRAHGATYRKTLGTYPDLKVDAARKHAHRVLNDVAEWRAGGYHGLCPMARPDDERLTFADAFEQFVGSARKKVKDREKAEKRTRDLYQCYLSSIAARPIDTLSDVSIVKLHERLSKEHGPIAANRGVEVVKAVFNFLIRKNLCADNPAKNVTMSPSKSRTRFLQPDELGPFKKALDSEKNRDLAEFVGLLLATGVRKSNLYSARWDNISLPLATWTIPGTESKNGELLSVALTAPACAILKSRLEKRAKDCPWVFPSQASRSGHIEDFKNQWKRLLKNAGLTVHLTMHDLRRTNASYQAIAGNPLQTIGQSLGHRSSTSTEVYARLTDAAVRRSLESGEAMQQRLIEQVAAGKSS